MTPCGPHPKPERGTAPRLPRATSLVLVASCLWSIAGLAPHGAVAQASAPRVRTLGIVLFPGFEALDVYGPLEMWSSVGDQVRVVTVAKRRGAVASAQGAQTLADFSYRDAPALDLLLAPGGPGVRPLFKDAETLDFLRKRAATAEITMSVCNGASLLAAAGLLDGRRATTNKAYWKIATSAGPKVRWIRKARWVDDGNVVTSSGVSAGMDMSLHVIGRLFGTKLAEEIAIGTEYEWHRDAARDPFADVHGSSDD
jgi:transcriptional regulator GlxA family with amidase domain